MRYFQLVEENDREESFKWCGYCTYTLAIVACLLGLYLWWIFTSSR